MILCMYGDTFSPYHIRLFLEQMFKGNLAKLAMSLGSHVFLKDHNGLLFVGGITTVRDHSCQNVFSSILL